MRDGRYLAVSDYRPYRNFAGRYYMHADFRRCPRHISDKYAISAAGYNVASIAGDLHIPFYALKILPRITAMISLMIMKAHAIFRR